MIVFAYGTAAVVNMAATMSFLPRLVEPAQLQPAHARVDGADAVGSMAGPALGGLLVSTIGAPFAVLVDSLTYLYSAITLRRIDVDEPPTRTGVTARGLLADIVEGVRWAYGRSGLRTLAIATHGWFVGNAIVGVVLAPYAFLTLDLTAFQFGLVGAVGGVGAVVGTTITTAVGRRLGTGRTIILCHSIITCGVVAMVLAGEPTSRAAAIALLMLGQGLYGLAMGMSNSHEMSYRQLVTPDELQARTNTTLRSINRAVIVVVAPIAGVLADAVGIRPMLVVAAVVFALVAAGLASSPFRTCEHPSERYQSGIIGTMAMTLRLSEDDEKVLAELAELDGISRQEATVRAIREAAARRGHESAVRDASARARDRYADVLRRLGE